MAKVFKGNTFCVTIKLTYPYSQIKNHPNHPVGRKHALLLWSEGDRSSVCDLTGETTESLSPTSYYTWKPRIRSSDLLDPMEKVMERVIYDRHLPIGVNRNSLSERRFGFRHADFPMDAVNMVVNLSKGGLVAAVLPCWHWMSKTHSTWPTGAKIKGSWLTYVGVPEYFANLVETNPSQRGLSGTERKLTIKNTLLQRLYHRVWYWVPCCRMSCIMECLPFLF